MDRNAATGEFHELGLGDPLAISAAHGEGVTDFMELVLEPFPPEPPEPEEARHPRIAVVGRPNVGKSTLVNRLLGEERVIAFDTPGTTRDAIEIGFERDGKPYTLIDTAGVRKRGRVEEAVEKFSVVKTLQAIADANVVILVLDARQGIAEQDAHVAGFVLEAGRALVVAVNKWDGLDEYERAQSKQAVGHILAFLDFARVHYISARAGTGVNSLMASVDAAYASAMARLSTPRLTRALMAATARQAPPRSGLVRPKLRYAHQGGVNPPRVIIHGNALERLPETYKRYLERYFRRTFKLEGTPLKIELRSSRNPYVGRRS
jgi:GTP-binding protein